MRRSTLMAAATLPALLVGSLFSATVHAGDGLAGRALMEIDTLSALAGRYSSELSFAFVLLAIGSGALLAWRLATWMGRKVRGPMLRLQSNVD